MKTVLSTSAALALAAFTVVAVAQEKKEVEASPPPPVPQGDYPFGQVTKIPESDLGKVKEGVLQENLGTMLSPGDIGAVQNRKLDAQGATAYPGYAGKELPAARRLDVTYSRSRSQGAQNLRLAQNVPAPISFEDENGNPWPIVSITYDPRIYSINGQGCGENGAPKLISDDRPTLITVTPCKFWTWGTFTVQLQGINIPMVFVAGSGDAAKENYIDVPVIVHVEGRSPTAKSKPVAKAAPAKKRVAARKPVETGPSSAYQAFLHGTPPDGAVRMSTSDGSTSAWFYNGSLYLVAPYKIITPAYEAAASGNNTNVFVFSTAISRVMAADANGAERIISIR